MKAPTPSRRDRIRRMLADLKMPGSLEAADSILSGIDSGSLSGAEAIEALLFAQIELRNNRRLQAAMWPSPELVDTEKSLGVAPGQEVSDGREATAFHARVQAGGGASRD